MILGYTKNLSVQILISLLIKNGIKKVIISPGTTNLEFIAGLQYSNNFELYSAIDERSAAYMACGMAEESGEPIVITCTEATASRNYFPGLTEAYYRKLPILAVTGVHRYSQIGHLIPQIIDRSVSPVDLIKCKVQLPIIKDKEDIHSTEILINRALAELQGEDKGPVHIDLPCCNDNYDFSSKDLYDSTLIRRYSSNDDLPELPAGKIAIFVGNHLKFNLEDQNSIEKFCASHNAVVFCDHTSGYSGKYAVHSGILAVQNREYDIFNGIELLIHIGGATGDGPTTHRLRRVKQVWRVSPDGAFRDTFGKLNAVFQMTERNFFEKYSFFSNVENSGFWLECEHYKKRLAIPYGELPLSNVYIAAKITQSLPPNSNIHLGVSNTIRAWSLFDFPESVNSFCNVGCRGIDGILSSLVGAAIIDRHKLHFGVVGDLMFYYDMNALGNRDISANLRIILINNNGGGVFKLNGAPGHRFFGDEETNKFIAASKHFADNSADVVKNYVESLGFIYFAAHTKEEFDKLYPEFVSGQEMSKPILFEIFTRDEDERNAFSIVSNLDNSISGQAKVLAKQILGEKGTQFVKNIALKK